MFVAAKLVPPLMKRVGADAATTNSMFWSCWRWASPRLRLRKRSDLSLALGAFLAGLIVSESGTTHKMLDKLSPLRDAFVALFFVTIGALVDPRILISQSHHFGARLWF